MKMIIGKLYKVTESYLIPAYSTESKFVKHFMENDLFLVLKIKERIKNSFQEITAIHKDKIYIFCIEIETGNYFIKTI